MIVNHKDDLRRGVDFIGVTVPFVVHDGQGNFVMHKRSQKCRDEQGRWDIGSGAVEFDEPLAKAVAREIKEEYCADALEIMQLDVFDIHRDNNGTPTHWIAISHSVRVDPKQVKIGDKEKIDDIGWFNLDSLPKPLHSQIMKSLNAAHSAGVI